MHQESNTADIPGSSEGSPALPEVLYWLYLGGLTHAWPHSQAPLPSHVGQALQGDESMRNEVASHEISLLTNVPVTISTVN